MTSITLAIRSIVRDYKVLLESSSGPAASLGEELGTKVDLPPAGTKPPRDFGSEAAEVEQMVIRVARVIHARLEALRHIPGLTQPRWDVKTDRHHPIRRVTREVILDEEGEPSTLLAYLYNTDQRTVERIRRDAGRDPQTGERREVVPLTAPARETLRRLAEAEHGN